MHETNETACEQRECTLAEYIAMLPKSHTARKEFNELFDVATRALANAKACERDNHKLANRKHEFSYSLPLCNLDKAISQLQQCSKAGIATS